jgi:hypothetical protein
MLRPVESLHVYQSMINPTRINSYQVVGKQGISRALVGMTQRTRISFAQGPLRGHNSCKVALPEHKPMSEGYTSPPDHVPPVGCNRTCTEFDKHMPRGSERSTGRDRRVSTGDRIGLSSRLGGKKAIALGQAVVINQISMLFLISVLWPNIPYFPCLKEKADRWGGFPLFQELDSAEMEVYL